LAFTGIYPNPVAADGRCEFGIAHTKNETVTILISDANGKTVQRSNRSLVAGSNRIAMQFQHLPQGMYQARIFANGAEVATRTFIKL
jgi:hypothetical protein